MNRMPILYTSHFGLFTTWFILDKGVIYLYNVHIYIIIFIYIYVIYLY